MYIKRIITMIFISILLASCGIKGDLYLNGTADNSVKSSTN